MAVTNIQEIFDRISQVDPSRVQGINAVVLFNLSGEQGGKWTVIVDDQEGVKVQEGETLPPRVTFAMSAQDFLAMTSGTLSPVAAFMQGKIKITGDMSLAMRLQNILT